VVCEIRRRVRPDHTGDPAAAPVKTGFFQTTYGPDASGNEAKTGTISLSLEDVDEG
jgi:hypothetical protein